MKSRNNGLTNSEAHYFSVQITSFTLRNCPFMPNLIRHLELLSSLQIALTAELAALLLMGALSRGLESSALTEGRTRTEYATLLETRDSP